MATAAEPRPARLPLPGGREGASVRVHPLLCGQALFPRAAVLREQGRFAWRRALGLGVPRSEWLEVPIAAVAVEHPGAGTILIDAGLHPSVAVDPKQSFGRITVRAFRDISMTPEQAVPAQLAERGLPSPDTVVMTHLHVDHASGVSEFPDATFVLAAEEWRAATTSGPTHGYVRRQFDHAFDYRTLDFEGADADSYATFGRSFDLFGDGAVRLVFTPGHSAGHVSVILRLRERELLVTGDAAYLMETIETGHVPYRMDDEHRFKRSLREIQLYLKQAPDAVVIPGHDIERWGQLEPVYE
jgi:N-acyl homoserine lactone hydrolase